MKHLLTICLFLFIGLMLSSCNKDKDKDKEKPDEKDGVRINGILWAKSNVDMPGTFAANPEDAGMFYQWNRKVGWSSSDPLVNSDGGTEWDDRTPIGDTWEQKNDPCPCGWRVPTAEEFEKLIKAKDFWGDLNGVKGYLFGSGESTLFLPSAGYRLYNSGMINAGGVGGYYWSSSINSTGANYLILYFRDDELRVGKVTRNQHGSTIRCVADE